MFKTRELFFRSLCALAGCCLAACATQHVHTAPLEVEEIRPGLLKGYLDTAALPNSLALLPAPPAADSPEYAADQAAFQATRSLSGSPRWALATTDADIHFPPDLFSCALGVAITKEATPNLVVLLRRSLTDAGLATYTAKKHYQRERPFMVNNAGTCTPGDEPMLRKDGSYPSGHTSIGWTWALLLAEVAPEQQGPLLARGYAYGQSRVICGAHWQSDVTAGRVIASGVVARLHADPDFRAQIEAAKTEVANARKKGLPPTRDCSAEAIALTPETTP